MSAGAAPAAGCPPASPAAALAELLRAIDRSPAICTPPALGPGGQWRRQDAGLVGGSPLQAALASVEDGWRLLETAAEADPGCGAAVGCLLGLAVGDAVGHPLEFVPVDQSLPDGSGGAFSDPQRPCLLPKLAAGQLQYQNAYNRFQLRPGQWTDDCSMALCLADSLLVQGTYHGGDARCRWHMWWTHGYCNAFRHDEERPVHNSVGLGGNVAKSLDEIEDYALEKPQAADKVPGIYGSTKNDAGNGTIMRLAPVPLAYHVDLELAMDVATLQSRATHPGPEAAACCCFMTYFIVQAIAAHQHGNDPSANIQSFMQEQVRGFLQTVEAKDSMQAYRSMPGGVGSTEAMARLRALLRCEPPSPKEQNWHWQKEELAISEAIQARCTDPDGRVDPAVTYNGHPTIPTYFGAYCMDGLAMALWGVWHSTSFASCIQRMVNLLGDADTTAAIAGQLAGACYGWRGICAEEWGRLCLANLRRWDPCAEVGLRAAVLYHHGPRPEVRLVQAEGHPSVRVFAEPRPGAAKAGEVASGTRVRELGRWGDFVRVASRDLEGWVGLKNTVRQAFLGLPTGASSIGLAADASSTCATAGNSCPSTAASGHGAASPGEFGPL